jgi:hypothetical protein
MWTGAELLFSLYFRKYTQTFFFVTRLISNTINKVQWVDFKLENVLVSLHSLETLFVRNGELLGHSPIQKVRKVICKIFFSILGKLSMSL